MNALTYALEDTNEDVHGAALVALTRLREIRTTMLRRPAKPAPGTNPLPSSGSHVATTHANNGASEHAPRAPSQHSPDAPPEHGDASITNGRRTEAPPSMLELGS
jgi:hypothetical protein